ncbi:hypothetical protein GLOIN_2v1846149 [Rhizophagus irregularis DAOM 181602=DAOM 197198]|nr:hypothetical protein GLOIN_2v1846149 [Rhizophagus irregularis DAOM 181602=DAOM 197198]
MYSASQGFNAVYSGIKERSEGRKQMLRLVRKIMRNTDDDDDQLGVDQDVIINRSIADASGSQSHVDQHIDMDISTVQPISELDVTPQLQLVKQPVDNSSNLTKSSNKKKKSNKNIIQQVITGHKPDDDGTSWIRDILVYDIPVSLTPEEILQQGIPVQWFPARWTLKERKQREKFQATIRKIPDSMTVATLWKDHRPHSFLTAINGLKSFKIVQTAKGDRKLIGYFEKWVDMRTALDNQYDWEQQHLSWNRHDPPMQRTRTSGKTKSEKHKKQKKDKSRKTSRSKVLAEILDVLRKLI